MTAVLDRVLARRELTVDDVVRDALAWLREQAQPDGSIAEDPGSAFFRTWDSVNALRAAAAWRADGDWVDALRDFLATRESPDGLLHPGAEPCARLGYCVETSSEYLVALAQRGELARARPAAEFLAGRQRDDGGWDLTDPRVPKAFHDIPSVTAFALLALRATDVRPPMPAAALARLARAQRPDGHFGANRFYYHTPFYVMRPVVEALAGQPAVVAAATEHTRAAQHRDGSWDVAADDSLSPETVTALALGVLVAAGVHAGDPAVRRGLTWLLDRRGANGSWHGGRYPYHPATGDLPDVRTPQDVFVTSQILILLAALARLENDHG